METIKKIFTKKSHAKSKSAPAAADIPVMEVAETSPSAGLSEIEPIYIKSAELQSLIDVQDVANELQEGNIVIVDITPMMDEDPAELKRAVDQLKGICQGMGGDVGRLSETKVIATPKFVRIQFKRAT